MLFNLLYRAVAESDYGTAARAQNELLRIGIDVRFPTDAPAMRGIAS